ncbi:MAG: nuclear transport factor 2 family protein [Reyranella sp.]|uniref:nuclear transport factor 2 family protein n=1 Tax=Reyranella sp. TaxID=1929291 RepID=UPI003D0C3276
MDECSTSIALSFNDCINRRDLKGLAALMADRHVFIDSADNTISGKSRCIEAWRGFFASFPDYRNQLERVFPPGETVVLVGYSVCSDLRLAGAALWTATIENARVAEWRVYEDTSENRKRLAIDD